ncbi:MAG TPA: hypothetical protein VFB36_01010 [Nevskiaceae bacterium]|nr:hypothetical protein [Nevskiaceae bacterium]
MSATPSPIAGFAARLSLLFLALVAGAAQATAPVAIANKAILDTGATVALSAPAIAVDPSHNVHITALGSAPGSLDTCKSGGHLCNVYYLLVSQAGKVLIKPSQINSSSPGKHGHPQIALTSTGKAVITWGAGRSGCCDGPSEFLRYALVDPSKQGTLNGSALKPAALAVPETEVGNAEGSKHALVLDSKNIAYVVRSAVGRRGTDPLRFLKFDPATGNVLHAESDIASTGALGANSPSIALDSKGNLHVVYGAADLGDDSPAGYTMLDSDGNVLIGTTQLDDAVPGIHPHVQKQHLALIIGANDIVNIVYGDKRNTPDAGHYNDNRVGATGGTTIYTRLDPSKAIHNGNPSNMATLRVGSDIEIPGFWYGRAFMAGDKFIHVIGGVGKTGSLAHVAFDPKNGTIILQPVIHTGATLNGVDYGPKFVAGAQNEVVWSESVPNGTTLRLVMAPINSFY